MNFDQLIARIDQLRALDAPGTEAHERIFPGVAQHRVEAMKKDPDPKLSAVAAILFPAPEASILLIERQTYDGVHSGQIGFPGGRVEQEDLNLEHTARRETQEEVGIPGESLQLIRPLSEVYIPPSRFLVHPFIFHLSDPPALTLEEREVRSALVMPVSKLLDENTIMQGEIPLQNGLKIKTSYFNHGDKKIWGATAMMLSELKILLQQL